MKSYNTIYQMLSTYDSNIYTFNIPIYSKLLNISINNNNILITYESSYEYSNDNSKILNIQLYRGDFINTSTYYNYHSSIIVPNVILNNISNGNNISMNIINISDNYHIFVNEIEPISEIREKKLEKLV